MQNAVMAIWHHSQSTDENPDHDLCPHGENSWCGSNPLRNKTVNGKQPDGTVIQVQSALVDKSYNKNMGGVALHD